MKIKIFRKTNISYPLIRIRARAYQSVKNLDHVLQFWYMAQLFPSETLLWRIVPKNKMQNKIQFRKSRSTWEQSCQSHPLTNIQTFICDFAREMTIFNRNACNYQTATRWDLPLYRITIWLIDDMMLIFVCLLVDLIWF